MRKKSALQRQRRAGTNFLKKSLSAIEFNNDIAHLKKGDRDRCFILATGPSIQQQDLSMLSGEDCIAVSMFHVHDLLSTIKPKWHVLAPPHPPFKFDTVGKIVNTIIERYGSNLPQIIFGHTGYEFSYLNFISGNPTIQDKLRANSYFVNYDHPVELSEKGLFKPETWDLKKTPFQIRTVIYAAIQLAVYLGYKEIVLLGCDHDYLRDISRTENHHFYAEAKGFSDKVHLGEFDRERWFKEYYLRWRDFRIINTSLRKRNIRIIDSTLNGMLDVFEKVPFEEVIH